VRAAVRSDKEPIELFVIGSRDGEFEQIIMVGVGGYNLSCRIAVLGPLPIHLFRQPFAVGCIV